MTNLFEQIRYHFNTALERDGLEAQLLYVAESCGDIPELRARVEEMVRAHHDQDGFLATQAESTQETQISRECVGSQIGPYKLLEQIGEGGMGVVYMAEQHHPVRRKVVLKIIKPGMDTRQVIVRFETERLALAMMDHPNIARVLEAGATDAGRPYFVMELVKGMPITNYCNEHQLTPRERLELFVGVCSRSATRASKGGDSSRPQTQQRARCGPVRL